ncbi:hypothetical protein T484DRAFT_1809348, partial [Baffinella frigidus]
VELAVNLFSNWFWDFVSDGWSVFDLIVVTVSYASMFFVSYASMCFGTDCLP